MARKQADKPKKPAKVRTIKLDELAATFLADLPPEAATGSYGPTVNDALAGVNVDVEDGDHDCEGGWTFTIAGGRFVGARLTPPPAE